MKALGQNKTGVRVAVRRSLPAALLLALACSSPHGDITPDAGADRPIDQAGVPDGTAGTRDVPIDLGASDNGGSASGGSNGSGGSSGTDGAPPVDATVVPAVVITTAGPLDRATVGIRYMTTIAVTGGVVPYTFSLPGLPATLSWLSIDGDGNLAGTPSQAIVTAVSLTVAVHDSRSATAPESTATKAYAVTVGACTEGTQVDCAGPLAGGVACGFGKSTCTGGVSGACVATTPSTDTSRCGNNCGACDATTAKTCASGVCKCGASNACTGGTTCCGNGGSASCVDTTTRLDNCGGCGVACDATRANACSGGACKCGTGAPCAAGQTCCGGACYDLTRDVDHCLACGSTCDRNKADNCLNGCRCGNNAACGNGQTCCGGACVDTATNTSNCGGCGKICPAGTNACLTGTCSCGSHVGACAAGTTCCTDNCYNLTASSSSLHCGTCGHSCLGDACSSSACQPTPVSGPAAAPYNFPPTNSGGTSGGGHSYTFNYAIAPDGKQDPAIFKDGSTTPLCIWTTYSAGGEEVAFLGMTVDASFVYGLLNGGPEGLFKCPVGGGTAISLFETSGLGNNGLVDNGTALYWEALNSSTNVDQVYRLVK